MKLHKSQGQVRTESQSPHLLLQSHIIGHGTGDLVPESGECWRGRGLYISLQRQLKHLWTLLIPRLKPPQASIHPGIYGPAWFNSNSPFLSSWVFPVKLWSCDYDVIMRTRVWVKRTLLVLRTSQNPQKKEKMSGSSACFRSQSLILPQCNCHRPEFCVPPALQALGWNAKGTGANNSQKALSGHYLIKCSHLWGHREYYWIFSDDETEPQRH